MELPAAVTGVMDVRFGSKTHSASMKKGDIWQIGAKSRTTSLPLDLDFSLLAPDGKELASIDDVPGSTDPELTFTVPEDGIYRIVLADRSGHSGDRGASYRLSIDRPQEDFKATVPDLLSVLTGASTKVSITVVRRGGFQGPINLAIEGLPVGITVPANLVIPENKNDLALQRMEMRFGILPEGAMMKVTHRSGEYQAVIGEELRIPLTVSRVPEFQEPVRLELVPSEDQKDSISAEPISLQAGESEAALQVHVGEKHQIEGEQKLLIRATAYQNGKWLVKSETTVAVELRSRA